MRAGKGVPINSRKPIVWFCSSVVPIVLASFSVAKEFPLKVNDGSGLDAPWPLVASLAFPKGELRDSARIRVVSDRGEVPSQVDVAATWQDGSIRWAHAGFTASPQGNYRIEYGEVIARSPYPRPLQITGDEDGVFAIDTGAAVYRFDGGRLLPAEGSLISAGRPVPVLSGSGSGAYLVDNSGRTARVAGSAAAIESKILKRGPARCVVKRWGWYVTSDGQRLARAEMWFYFAQGSPYVRMTHSIIFTEDTNRVWFKDYGLDFGTASGPSAVQCALGAPGQGEIRRVAAGGGSEVHMRQYVCPHFAERESRAVIGRTEGDTESEVCRVETAGDWAHGEYAGYGLTFVMPYLAERFPKEISFGPAGARAVLWSGRSGRELDFRPQTLVKEYYGR